MSNKAYNICKWVLLIFVPAFITFLSTIGSMFDLEWMSVVVGVITAAASMFGGILQISTNYYNQVESLKPSDVEIHLDPSGNAANVEITDKLAAEIKDGFVDGTKYTCSFKK